MSHTVETIIHAAGGRRVIAFEMNIHTVSVDRWSRTGIPAKYWDILTAFARAQNVLLTPKDFEQANKAIGAAENESAE